MKQIYVPRLPGPLILFNYFFTIIFMFISGVRVFLFFGYGPGSFEILFQISYFDLRSLYANHAHSDIIEFIGEFGLVGFILIVLSSMIFFIKKNSYTFINMIIMSYIMIILFFDFSMHIPLIQIMIIIFLTLNKKKFS